MLRAVRQNPEALDPTVPAGAVQTDEAGPIGRTVLRCELADELLEAGPLSLGPERPEPGKFHLRQRHRSPYCERFLAYVIIPSSHSLIAFLFLLAPSQWRSVRAWGCPTLRLRRGGGGTLVLRAEGPPESWPGGACAGVAVGLRRRGRR